MKAVVDKETCIGCGLCPNICPAVFDMDDDGKAVAQKEELNDSVVGKAQEAEDSCPVDAITVE